MPIFKSFMEICNNGRQEHFIHIQELPWLAYQRDIRDFFQGLSVKDEGILIRHYDAFVAFDDPNDIFIATRRDNHLLLGSKVQLSVISKADLRQLLFRIARRKLDFTEKDGIMKRVTDKPEYIKRKKIRPTPVMKSTKRKTESSLVFCPEESDLPPPQYDKQLVVFPWTYDNEFFPSKKKKIHPVRLSDTIEIDNFSLFHPEICHELKTLIEIS